MVRLSVLAQIQLVDFEVFCIVCLGFIQHNFSHSDWHDGRTEADK